MKLFKKETKKGLIILCGIFVAMNLIAKESTIINSDWKFTKSNVINAQQVTFDDTSWDNISLPHTWNAQDCQDG